jgi:PilZ domain
MFRSRLYARELVQEVEMIILRVFPAHTKWNKSKVTPYTKRVATISDYSLSGLRIKTSTFLYATQRVDIELDAPHKLVVPAEVVGLRRRVGNQYEFAIQLLIDQNQYHQKNKEYMHPMRQYHIYRKTKGYMEA